MENIQIPLQASKKKYNSLFEGISDFFIKEKFSSTISIAALLFVSLALAYVVSKLGVTLGVLILLGIVGLPTVYAIIAYPKVAVTILLILAYNIMFFNNLGINFPVGTIMDGLEVLLIFGFFLKQKFNPQWKIYRNPTSIMVLIWIGYNLLEVANPAAASRLAWVFTVRTVAIVMLLYFIFLYHMRDVKFIRFVFKLWIFLTLIAAIYAVKQEFVGFAAFEENMLYNDPVLRSLYFIDGHWRKFSIFSDPVTYAYNMVISAVLCFCLLTGPIATWKKIILTILGFFFLFIMLYSGTRGAYVLIPSALGMFCILKFSKKILVACLVLGGLLTFVIMAPSTNQTIKRFQSAFRPEEDASYNVRKNNQKKIQPYILSHPIGGGLGSTGTWGQRFSPNTFLANFPPDSGYVRVAVELGWVGLLIFCTFMFIVIRTGINNYFKIKDPELKSYCLALTLIAFVLNIGNFPQEALVQYPTNVYFYLTIALINALPLLQKSNENKKQPQTL